MENLCHQEVFSYGLRANPHQPLLQVAMLSTPLVILLRDVLKGGSHVPPRKCFPQNTFFFFLLHQPDLCGGDFPLIGRSWGIIVWVMV